MTKQYRVKGIPGLETYVELLNEVAGGFEARITSVNDHGIRESCEFISNDLLDSCVRTGYLIEAKTAESGAAQREAEPVLTA